MTRPNNFNSIELFEVSICLAGGLGGAIQGHGAFRSSSLNEMRSAFAPAFPVDGFRGCNILISLRMFVKQWVLLWESLFD